MKYYAVNSTFNTMSSHNKKYNFVIYETVFKIGENNKIIEVFYNIKWYTGWDNQRNLCIPAYEKQNISHTYLLSRMNKGNPDIFPCKSSFIAMPNYFNPDIFTL